MRDHCPLSSAQHRREDASLGRVGRSDDAGDSTVDQHEVSGHDRAAPGGVGRAGLGPRDEAVLSAGESIEVGEAHARAVGAELRWVEPARHRIRTV